MNPLIQVREFGLILALTLAASSGAEPKPTATGGPPAETSATNGAATGAAQSTASAVPKSRPKLSPAVASQISSELPVWNSPPAEPRGKPPPLDPDVVKMDPLIVLGDRLPRTDRLDWLTPDAKNVELVKTYLTPFDRYFLDRFTLPIVGMSKEGRARMMYEEDKRLRDLKWMNEQIDEVKRLDPDEAKALVNSRNTIFVRPQP